MMKPKMSFAEILGENAKTYSENERRSRWEQWQTCVKSKAHKEMVEYWSDHGECNDCIHLDKSKGYGWCRLYGLPNTVNPILSFRMGMIGLACMGLGGETQTELFYEAEGR